MSDRIWRYKTYDPDELNFKDQYREKPIDKLERLLDPIYRRYAKHPDRDDARLAFTRDIRRVTTDPKWSKLYRKIYNYTNNPDHRGTAFNTAILEVERWMYEIDQEQS